MLRASLGRSEYFRAKDYIVSHCPHCRLSDVEYNTERNKNCVLADFQISHHGGDIVSTENQLPSGNQPNHTGRPEPRLRDVVLLILSGITVFLILFLLVLKTVCDSSYHQSIVAVLVALAGFMVAAIAWIYRQYPDFARHFRRAPFLVLTSLLTLVLVLVLPSPCNSSPILINGTTPECRSPTLSIDMVANLCRSTIFTSPNGVLIVEPRTCGTPPATSNGANLAWRVNSEGAFSGCTISVTPAPSADFSSVCGSLTIQVSGAQGGERIQIGLRDSSGNEHKELVVVPTDGSPLKIQLETFVQHNVDTDNIAMLIFGFEHNVTSNQGSICVSDVSFGS